MRERIEPDAWVPRRPTDLVGVAGRVAAAQIAKAERSPRSRIKLLLHGDPGCGKTAACRIIAESIALPHAVTTVSACELTAEIVRDWIGRRSRLFEGWAVFHLEECDAINPTVEVLMLRFLDALPPQTAVLCTSNASLGDLTDRFQSRFQAIEVRRPEPGVVGRFLAERWPEIADVAGEIAATTRGDIRAALNDAQGHIDMRAVAAGAAT